MPNQRHVSKFAELDGGGVFSGKKSFTRMQIKPKILRGRKPKMTYITGVKNTINPKIYETLVSYDQTLNYKANFLKNKS